MRNETLEYCLKKFNLCECIPLVENYIYYLKTPFKQRCYLGNGKYRYVTSEFEFLIIAENGIKQAIILRCDDVDLHWYVLKKWRKKHVLSNALRTDVIREIWPENTTVTCCCAYDDNYSQKMKMTKHLAEIAHLQFKET